MEDSDKTKGLEQEVEILLVEDNPTDLELALHALEANHLLNRIDVARDGAEALDYLFRRGAYTQRGGASPRVVLLDLKLPKVDGLEVLRQIRAHEATRDLPVVMMTSSHEERDLIESYRSGANSYIVKPVDFSQFTDAIRHVGFYWVLLNEPPIC